MKPSKLHYYFYLIVCLITHPFRWLMPWYDNFEFALKFLFPNDWVRCWVWSQSYFETAGWTSNRFKANNNYFNIGVSKNKTYQSGESAPVNMAGEPDKFARYWSVYQSLYDYYDLVFNPERKTGDSYSREVKQTVIDKVLDPSASGNFVPSAPFENTAFIASGALAKYFGSCASAFKTISFYTADPVNYGMGCAKVSPKFKENNWRYYLNYLYTFSVLYLIYIYSTDSNHSRSAKQRIRAFKAKFT